MGTETTRVALTGLIIQIIKSVYYAFRCLCGTCASDGLLHVPLFLNQNHTSWANVTLNKGASAWGWSLFFRVILARQLGEAPGYTFSVQKTRFAFFGRFARTASRQVAQEQEKEHEIKPSKLVLYWSQ